MSKRIDVQLQVTGEHLTYLTITPHTTSRDVKMKVSDKMDWPCATLDLVIDKQPVKNWFEMVWKLCKGGEKSIGVVRRTYPKPSSISFSRGCIQDFTADQIRACVAHDPLVVNFCARAPITSPLSVACIYGAVDTINVLLDVGADVNYASAYTATPLTMAVFYNKPRALALLVKAKADVSCNFEALFRHAKENGYDECVNLLVAAKADPNTAK